MLPEFLVGTYDQYKRDTNFIATWLGSTARSFGYSSDTVPLEQEQVKAKSKPKAKTNKSKTKKQKRDAARRVPQEQRKHVISIEEFLPLAQHIASKMKSPSKVPTSVVSAVKRTIEARRDTSDWFRSIAANDTGHDHFVDILCQVLKILEPYSSKEEVDSADEDTLVNNMFETLEIQEPSQQFVDSPGTPQKDYTQGRMLCEFVDAFMEYVQGYLEETHAAAALFRDINRIYKHAEQTWRQYKEGKVDLMTAAITSNTAIDLIRRLEEDFFETFPKFRRIDEAFLKQFKKYDRKHKDAQQLINFMFRAKQVASGKPPYDEKLFKSEFVGFHPDLYEEARYVFLDIDCIFLGYFVTSQRMSKVVYDHRTLGTWYPEANYEALPPIEKYRQDRLILAELLPDMTILATSVSGIPTLAEDELLRGSRNFMNFDNNQPILHLWTLASLRLFCDIHHILGSDIGKPFEALRRLATDTKNIITECTNARDRGDRDYWPKESDVEIEQTFIKQMHQSLFVDEVKEYIDHAARNVKWWPGKKGFELLRRHPIVCGLMEFSIRATMQEIGLVSLLHTHLGITAAHLYNALKQEGTCKTKWTDMDLFLDIHGEEAVFRGPRPTQSEDYATRLMLTQGLSAATFAQNRRDRGMLLARTGRHYILPANKLINVLKIRYVNTREYTEKGDKDCKDLLQVLEQIIDDQYALVADGANAVVHTRDATVANTRKLQSTPKGSKYTPVEFLMSLEFGLSREIPSIFFDYLAFHKSCWVILTSVQDMCAPMVDQVIPNEVRMIETPPSFWASYPVLLIFAMGVPLSKARKMIRKSTMPHIPPVTSEFQQVFDQHAIFKDLGSLFENRIANGRLRQQSNVKARKLMDARPAMAVFKLAQNVANDKRITFNGHKMWAHTNPRCSKSVCVCGAKGVPTMKSGWKKRIIEAVADRLANAT